MTDTSQTRSNIPVSDSVWVIHPDATGRFTLTVRVPGIINVGDGGALWRVDPGVHHFVVSVDRDHTASAAFTVTESSVTPSP